MVPSRSTVLLVEDELPHSQVLTRALCSRGWAVRSVSSGREALEVAASTDLLVMVLDINLPDITGWEVLRQLSPATRERTPVIVYSAATPAPSRVAEFRPAGVLTKPFSMDALVRLVATAASHRDDPPASGEGRVGAPAASRRVVGEIVIAGSDLRWILRCVAQVEPLSNQVTALHREDPLAAALLALERSPAALVVAVPAGTPLAGVRPLLDRALSTRCLLVLSEQPTPSLRELVSASGGAICSIEDQPVLIAATLITMLAHRGSP
jgi:DNA-binding response OmpR family regulator